MSGVNPQSVEVSSFKTSGPEALAHDFFWRANRALPARGHIGIFNRSHYEEVLVVRVHPKLLQNQQLPRELVSKQLWNQRLEAIAAFERYLTQQGTVVRKFFLNLSKEEQRDRPKGKVRVRRLGGTGVVPSPQRLHSLVRRCRSRQRFEPSTSCALPVATSASADARPSGDEAAIARRFPSARSILAPRRDAPPRSR